MPARAAQPLNNGKPQRPGAQSTVLSTLVPASARQLDHRSSITAAALGVARVPGGAQVAQLVEHATENRSVGGSIPPLGTSKINNLLILIFAV